MMKHLFKCLPACLAAVLLLSCAMAETAPAPQVILYTCYEYAGPVGLTFQAGCVDDEGRLWTVDRVLENPGDLAPKARLEQMLAAGELTPAGEMSWSELFELKSLMYTLEDQGTEAEAVCEGAGAESSWAFIPDGGEAQEILLGVSGDSRFENTDPDAQALYLFLRTRFPAVTSYAYTPEYGPAGFQPVALTAFLGWEKIDFTKAEIRCQDNDCEAGPIPVELTEEDRGNILAFLANARVTGKANGTEVTGGTTTYAFFDETGEYICSFELYEGLLVLDDGMYSLAR